MSDLCSPLLANVKQLGAIVEASCGSGGSFVAADFKTRISSATVDIDMSPIEDDTLTASLSPRALAMGEKKASAKVAAKLVGSGVSGTKPEIDILLRGCAMTSVVVSAISIGAVTGGPFIPGETVTQATSLATGRVMKVCNTGDAKLYLTVLTGTFNATDVITGGTSAATATASSTASAAGFAYHPVTAATPETVALRLEEDGRFKTVNGAAGTFTISADSSGVMKIEFTMNGKYGEVGDAAMTSNVTYADTAFPTFVDARCFLDLGLAGEVQPIVRSVSVDLQGEATLRKDANQTTGLLASRITKRTPQIVLTAEAMKKATFDAFGKMADCDAVTLGFRAVAPDNTVEIWGLNGQLTTVPEGDADGFSTMDLTFRMNGLAGDDELWIVFTV